MDPSFAPGIQKTQALEIAQNKSPLSPEEHHPHLPYGIPTKLFIYRNLHGLEPMFCVVYTQLWSTNILHQWELPHYLVLKQKAHRCEQALSWTLNRWIRTRTHFSWSCKLSSETDGFQSLTRSCPTALVLNRHIHFHHRRCTIRLRSNLTARHFAASAEATEPVPPGCSWNSATTSTANYQVWLHSHLPEVALAWSSAPTLQSREEFQPLTRMCSRQKHYGTRFATEFGRGRVADSEQMWCKWILEC